MRKVTTINLNGRAYQLEEQGYELLQKYLHRAEAALHDNPDKSEVMTDLEQAIADKCDPLLKDGKNVVTSEQIEKILEQMGEVEGDDTTADLKADRAPGKRLFTIRDGAVILGVGKGIGVYLGIDPNIVRVVIVLLTLATHGFAIAAYVLLGIFLPRAKTDAELAEAYGKPIKAQDVVERVRERAADPETIQRVSDGIVNVFRVAMRIVGIGFAVLFGILTFAWLWMLWQLLLGRYDLHGNLQVLNGWRELLVATLAYLVVALPVYMLFRVFDRFGENRQQSRRETVGETTLGVLWGVAVIASVLFVTTYAGHVRKYVNEHNGKLDIGTSHLCVDGNRCADVRTPRDPQPSMNYHNL